MSSSLPSRVVWRLSDLTYFKDVNHLKVYDVFEVKGSLEIPVQISILLKRKKYDAVIAVGCIIKGKTDHVSYEL